MTEPAWDLVEPHRERLVKVARRRVGSYEDAEDIVQEAMIRVATFPALDHGRVGEMLTSVTMRLCVDFHRHRAVEKAAAPRLLPVEPDPLAVLLDEFEARWLADVPLTKVERTLLLARVHGLYPSEVAAGLGLTLPAAKHALERARRKITRAWKATLGLIGALRLRRLLPAGGAVVVAMAALVLTLVPAVPERTGYEATAVEPPEVPVRPAVVSSPVSRVRPGAEQVDVTPVPAASPAAAAPVVVSVPGVHGKGFGAYGVHVKVDTSEDPVTRVFRCVKNGIEIDPGSGSATCRE